MAQEMILSSSSKRKVDKAHDSEDEEDQEEGSLVRRSRARRCVISDDEATPPLSSFPMHEPESPTLVSSEKEMSAAPRDSSEQFFSHGFDIENFGFVSEEAPLASFPVFVPVDPPFPAPVVVATAPPVDVLTPSTAPTITTSHVEVGSFSNSRVMKKVTIEVPKDANLLKKSGHADVWLKLLIELVEKSKLDSYNSLTWMNEIVHLSLKISLINTELMKRIVHTKQLMNDYCTEAGNLKELFEGYKLEKEVLDEEKCTLEQ